MSRSPFFHTRTLLLLFGTLLIAAGCASRPPYGASPRHKRGCDCPKWNAVPGGPGKDIRVDGPERPRDIASLNDGHDH